MRPFCAGLEGAGTAKAGTVKAGTAQGMHRQGRDRPLAGTAYSLVRVMITDDPDPPSVDGPTVTEPPNDDPSVLAKTQE